MLKPSGQVADSMDTDELQEEASMDSMVACGTPVSLHAVQSALAGYRTLSDLLDAPAGEPHLGDACVDFVIAVIDRQPSDVIAASWDHISRLVLGDAPYAILGIALTPLALAGPPGFAQRAARAQRLFYSTFLQAMYRSSLDRTLSTVMQSLHTYASSQTSRLAQAARALYTQQGHLDTAAGAAYKLLEDAIRMVLEAQPLTLVVDQGLLAKACLPLAGHTAILSVFKYAVDTPETIHERYQVVNVLFSPVDQSGAGLLGTVLSILESGTSWQIVQTAVELLRDAASMVPYQLANAFTAERNQPSSRLLQLLRVLRRFTERFATSSDPFIAQLQPIQVTFVLQALLAVLHALLESKPGCQPADSGGTSKATKASSFERVLSSHERVLISMPAFELKSTLTDLLRALLVESWQQPSDGRVASGHIAQPIPGYASDLLPVGGFVVQHSCGIRTRRTGRLLIAVLRIIGCLVRISAGSAAATLGQVACCSDMLPIICCNAMKMHPLCDPLHAAVANVVIDVLSCSSSLTLRKLFLEQDFLSNLNALTAEGPRPASMRTIRHTYVAALGRIVAHIESGLPEVHAAHQPARRLSAPRLPAEGADLPVQPAGHKQRNPSCPGALAQGYEAYQANPSEADGFTQGEQADGPYKSHATMPASDTLAADAAGVTLEHANSDPYPPSTEDASDDLEPTLLATALSDPGQTLTNQAGLGDAGSDVVPQHVPQECPSEKQEVPVLAKQLPALLYSATEQTSVRDDGSSPTEDACKAPAALLPPTEATMHHRHQQSREQTILQSREYVLWQATQKHPQAWSQLKAVTAAVRAASAHTRMQWDAGSPEEAVVTALNAAAAAQSQLDQEELQSIHELPAGSELDMSYADVCDEVTQRLEKEEVERAAAQQLVTEEALMLLEAAPVYGPHSDAQHPQDAVSDGNHDVAFDSNAMAGKDGAGEDAGNNGRNACSGLQVVQRQAAVRSWNAASGRRPQSVTVQLPGSWPGSSTAQDKADTAAELAEIAADAQTAVFITTPADDPSFSLEDSSNVDARAAAYRTAVLARRTTGGGAVRETHDDKGDGDSSPTLEGPAPRARSSGGVSDSYHSWGSSGGDSWGSPRSQPADDYDDHPALSGGNDEAEPTSPDHSNGMPDNAAVSNGCVCEEMDMDMDVTPHPDAAMGSHEYRMDASKQALMPPLPPLLLHQDNGLADQRSNGGTADQLHGQVCAPKPDKSDSIAVVCLAPASLSAHDATCEGGKLQHVTMAGNPADSNGSPAGNASRQSASMPPSKSRRPIASSSPSRKLAQHNLKAAHPADALDSEDTIMVDTSQTHQDLIQSAACVDVPQG